MIGIKTSSPDAAAMVAREVERHGVNVVLFPPDAEADDFAAFGACVAGTLRETFGRERLD